MRSTASTVPFAPHVASGVVATAAEADPASAPIIHMPVSAPSTARRTCRFRADLAISGAPLVRANVAERYRSDRGHRIGRKAMRDQPEVHSRMVRSTGSGGGSNGSCVESAGHGTGEVRADGE